MSYEFDTQAYRWSIKDPLSTVACPWDHEDAVSFTTSVIDEEEDYGRTFAEISSSERDVHDALYAVLEQSYPHHAVRDNGGTYCDED